MSPATIFNIHLVLGYVPWLLCFGAYIWPRLKSMDRVEAQRAIATLHSFRFFGLVFLVPGVVGANLPAGFAEFAAYGDFATGLLAMLALLTVRIRPLFWLLVVAFNLVGAADILVDYYHGNQIGLPALAGQLGADLRDPDHLCAAADDHARRGVLFAAAAHGEAECRSGVAAAVLDRMGHRCGIRWRVNAFRCPPPGRGTPHIPPPPSARAG